MTGEVNRVPVGLLSLLDMKARGQAPRLLSAEVQAGIDLLRIYVENDRTLWRASVSVTAVGATLLSQFTVPERELWLVHAFTFDSATLAAGTTVRLAGGFRRVDQNSGNNNFLTITPSDQATAGERLFGGVTFTTPWIARAGDVFTFHCSSFAGTAPSVVGSLDFSRISL